MQPAELELLGRVFDRSSVPNETEREREARASRIIGYFLAGIRDEDELSHLARQPLGR
jgi:hypothetical protein